jgi:integrase
MARVTRRTWIGRGPTGRKVKHVAYGFTITEGGNRVRKYDARWTREDAEKALAAHQLGVTQKAEVLASAPSMTFGEAVERYLKAKARKKSVANDALYFAQLQASLGETIPLSAITASRISAWKAERLAAVNPKTGQPYAAASINRPLAALRHLLRIAHEEWDALQAVPKVRLEKEPEGRIRWLEPDEEARLMEACRRSRSPHLAGIVTVALETGMRRGELLGLTWDRIDMSRGVLRLEVTKSGRRREVPMRQVVYDVLASLSGPREGRVWAQRKVRSAFETAVAGAKLDDFRFHDCRHHFASWFVMRGGGLQALKELLGHADLKMTLRYAHLAPHYLRDEIAKTARWGGEAPTETTMVSSLSIRNASVATACSAHGDGSRRIK